MEDLHVQIFRTEKQDEYNVVHEGGLIIDKKKKIIDKKKYQ